MILKECGITQWSEELANVWQAAHDAETNKILLPSKAELKRLLEMSE